MHSDMLMFPLSHAHTSDKGSNYDKNWSMTSNSLSSVDNVTQKMAIKGNLVDRYDFTILNQFQWQAKNIIFLIKWTSNLNIYWN